VGEVWIEEAEDLKAAGTSGEMEGGHPRVTWHVTVSPSGRSRGGTQYFDVMHRVLTSKKSEPHVLYDPVTDRLGQYFPLNRSARALANDGARRTNGAGTVNIQIEVVGDTSPVFTKYWTPGPNFRALMRAIRSWDIPDEWPSGRLATSYGDHVNRSWSSYSEPGHFAHCNVPGNDHWDTGPINQAAIFAASEEDDMTPAEVKKAVTEAMTEYKIIDPEDPKRAYVGLIQFIRSRVARRSDVGYARDQLLTAVKAGQQAGPAADADAIVDEIANRIANKETP
jgi:hypothetical protein